MNWGDVQSVYMGSTRHRERAVAMLAVTAEQEKGPFPTAPCRAQHRVAPQGPMVWAVSMQSTWQVGWQPHRGHRPHFVGVSPGETRKAWGQAAGKQVGGTAGAWWRKEQEIRVTAAHPAASVHMCFHGLLGANSICPSMKCPRSCYTLVVLFDQCGIPPSPLGSICLLLITSLPLLIAFL